MIAAPPDDRNDYAMPKSPDAAAAGGEDLLIVLPAENFKAQGGAKNANDRKNQCSDDGNLDTARPRELREASVKMNADFFRGRVALRGCGGFRGYRLACWIVSERHFYFRVCKYKP